MKCLNADATYGISSPTTPSSIPPSDLSLVWGQPGSLQTKSTWVMGSSWRTGWKMQLTFWTNRRDEPASDGPNYLTDLCSRLRAEGGMWVALCLTQIACRVVSKSKYLQWHCPRSKIDRISCWLKNLILLMFPLTSQGPLLAHACQEQSKQRVGWSLWVSGGGFDFNAGVSANQH